MLASGRSSAISVTAPRTSSRTPSRERSTTGETIGVRDALLVADFEREAPRERELVLRVDVDRVRARAMSLHLHDDREDHRAPARLLVEVLGESVLDLRLEQADLTEVVARRRDRSRDALHRALDERVIRPADEAARDDLRRADEVAGL